MTDNIPCGTKPEPGITCHICVDAPADLTLAESYCLPCFTSCADCHRETDGSLWIPGPEGQPRIHFCDGCFFAILSEEPTMAAVLRRVLGDVPELDDEEDEDA